MDGAMAGIRVQEGDRYRRPVPGCGCEVTVSNAPHMEPTQSFIDCRGREMERISDGGGEGS